MEIYLIEVSEKKRKKKKKSISELTSCKNSCAIELNKNFNGHYVQFEVK
jgi:hypothetical protein